MSCYIGSQADLSVEDVRREWSVIRSYAVLPPVVSSNGVPLNFSVKIRVGSLNNVPSPVRTTVVLEIPSARRWNVRRFWAVLINFGRFQRKYALETDLDSRFQARYGTLLKECTRTPNRITCWKIFSGMPAKVVITREKHVITSVTSSFKKIKVLPNL